MVKRKRGFTLIEFVTVLVIMAIIVLIVTPLVMSIIRKARISADKRSIDAYGRSIELAIASYLLDTGKFPTSIDQLTIEYSGSEVVCSQAQINPDSSVYLEDCRVGGRSVNYAYGTDKTPTYEVYGVGDYVSYNSVAYRVIKDSGAKEETVTLLKSEPLTPEELQIYSAGTGASISVTDGYGGMQYHSSSSAYATSYVKQTIDAWALDNIPSGLQEARLITYDELVDNLGYEIKEVCSAGQCSMTQSHVNTPNWVYSSNYRYHYWTMSPINDSSSHVWMVDSNGDLDDWCSVNNAFTNYRSIAVRPVIIISKSLISKVG